jgi:hypothetical protein
MDAFSIALRKVSETLLRVAGDIEDVVDMLSAWECSNEASRSEYIWQLLVELAGDLSKRAENR